MYSKSRMYSVISVFLYAIFFSCSGLADTPPDVVVVFDKHASIERFSISVNGEFLIKEHKNTPDNRHTFKLPNPFDWHLTPIRLTIIASARNRKELLTDEFIYLLSKHSDGPRRLYVGLWNDKSPTNIDLRRIQDYDPSIATGDDDLFKIVLELRSMIRNSIERYRQSRSVRSMYIVLPSYKFLEMSIVFSKQHYLINNYDTIFVQKILSDAIEGKIPGRDWLFDLAKETVVRSTLQDVSRLDGLAFRDSWQAVKPNLQDKSNWIDFRSTFDLCRTRYRVLREFKEKLDAISDEGLRQRVLNSTKLSYEAVRTSISDCDLAAEKIKEVY